MTRKPEDSAAAIAARIDSAASDTRDGRMIHKDFDAADRDTAAPSRPTYHGRSLLAAMRRAEGLPPLGDRERAPLAEVIRRARGAAMSCVPYEWDHGAARVCCAADITSKLSADALTATDGLTPCPRRDVIGMAHMLNYARNWARSERTRRDRLDDEADTANSAAGTLTADFVTDAAPLYLPADAARIAADSLAERVGLPKIAPLFYEALRDGAAGADLAEECGMTAAAWRQSVSRARRAALTAFPSADALAVALGLASIDDPSAGAQRPHAASLAPDARTTDGREYPLAVRCDTLEAVGGVAELWRRACTPAVERTPDRRWRELRAIRLDRRYRGADANAGNGLYAIR